MKFHRLVGADYTAYMKNMNGDRHRIQKALWDLYGVPFRVTNPSNRFIGIVRADPGEPPGDVIETEAESVDDDVMEAQAANIRRMKNSGHVSAAPSPKSCKCKEWPWPEGQSQPLDERRKPTAHHPKCAFKKMYERAKGHKITHVAAGPTLEPTIHKAGRVTNPAVSRGQLQGKPAKADKLKEKANKVPGPDRCPKCKDFTKSKKMLAEEKELGVVQHHQTCEYYKKYKAISHARKAAGLPPLKEAPPPKLKAHLMDLETMEVVREAEPEEVEEGRRRLRDEGVAFVEVDGEQYLCMHEDGTTLDPADPADPEDGVAGQAPDDEGSADTEPPGPPEAPQEEASA